MATHKNTSDLPGVSGRVKKNQSHPKERPQPTQHELEPNEDDRSRLVGLPADDEGQKQAAPTGSQV